MDTKSILESEEDFHGSKNKTARKIKKSTLKGKKEILQDELTQSDTHILEPDLKNEIRINITKKKTKKNKNTASISVKSSFRKFGSLEKDNASNESKDNKSCRICSKPVYKMEEIKAIQSVFHKNCFRCAECKKILNMDNYHSNESIIYCGIHFKILLGPRAVDEIEQEPNKMEKAELIITENQPVELPPDVIRASTKSDLGLAELQQLNLRSRFEVFENPKNTDKDAVPILEKKTSAVKTKNFENSEDNRYAENIENENNTEESDNLMTSLMEKPQTTGSGTAVQDLRDKFEKDPLSGKRDRREECKQEIQNIRSRLFTGKQARIKEMYQQAVMESEQAVKSVAKLEILEKSADPRVLKERFERGEFFRTNSNDGNELNEALTTNNLPNNVEVFNAGLSKESRSLFMELDANILAENQQKAIKSTLHTSLQKRNEVQPKVLGNKIPETAEIVKSNQLVEDVLIKTSEISSKYNFFEKYRPKVLEKKEFRITPPREGVVKMPTPESESDECEENDIDAQTDETQFLRRSHTTAKMVNKFRKFEEKQRTPIRELNKKSLKAITPPPDGNPGLYSSATESDDYSDDDYSEYVPVDEDVDLQATKPILKDVSLLEAQAAARAKTLRAKFENWEANEIEHEDIEQRRESKDAYSENIPDQMNLESTRSIRERFERLQSEENLRAPLKQRHQVNRFK